MVVFHVSTFILHFSSPVALIIYYGIRRIMKETPLTFLTMTKAFILW